MAREAVTQRRTSRGAGAALCAAALALLACGSRPSPIQDERPWIQRSTDHVWFELDAFEGGSLAPERAEVRVANGGLGEPTGAPTASIVYAVGVDWLTAQVDEDASGWVVRVAPEAVEALEPGTYTAVIGVAWEGAANSPAGVEVTLVVHPTGGWEEGHPTIADARYSHAVVALTDGGALAIGGRFAEQSIERLEPARGTWAAAGTLARGRQEHTATLLEDGRVLVAGGRNESASTEPPGASWELYDPAAGAVSGGGALREARSGHAAVLLGDGRVLLVGGGTRGAELFDPRTSATAATGALNGSASDRTPAVLLRDGRVLVTDQTASGVEKGTEIYDPASGAWTVAEPRGEARQDHALVLLADGRVLAVGGYAVEGGVAVQRMGAEIWDPATGHWAAAGTLHLAHSYVRDDAALLPSGKALIAGGLTDVALAYTSAVEVFDPATTSWSVAGTLGSPRGFHTVTVLSDGTLMALGGWPTPGNLPEFWREPR